MSSRNELRKVFQRPPQSARLLPLEAGTASPGCRSASLIVVDDPGCDNWPSEEVRLALTVPS